jgi:predicted DCC family thiol-disulfide oxidoreductase YuxK
MSRRGVGLDVDDWQLSDPGVLSGQALVENVAFFFVVLAVGVATVLGAVLWSVLRWWTRRRTDAAARRRLRAMGRGFRE